MIKTHEIKINNRYEKNIDAYINKFLYETHAIELVDIKYQTLALAMEGEYVIETSALIIYKELF